MKFCVVNENNEYTQTSEDTENLKTRFIELVKEEISKNLKDDNDYKKVNSFKKDPRLCFAKAALDNDGNLFAIICSDNNSELFRKLNPNCSCLRLTAFAMNSSCDKLIPLSYLSGHISLKEKARSRVSSIQTEESFRSRGIGREVLLCFQETCKRLSTSKEISLSAVFVGQTARWYEQFWFKTEKRDCSSLIPIFEMVMKLDKYDQTPAKDKSKKILKKADKETRYFIRDVNKEFETYSQNNFLKRR